MSGRSGVSLPLPPLRTQLASFPALGSSTLNVQRLNAAMVTEGFRNEAFGDRLDEVKLHSPLNIARLNVLDLGDGHSSLSVW